MVKIDSEKIVPICPYCEQEVERLIEVKRGLFTTNKVFCCPHCRKILGLSAGA